MLLNLDPATIATLPEHLRTEANRAR